MLGYAYGLAGRSGAARDVLHRMDELAKRCYVSPYDRAVLHTGLGEKDDALRYLRQALKERSPRVIWLNVEPAFDTLPAGIDIFRTSSAGWGWNEMAKRRSRCDLEDVRLHAAAVGAVNARGIG